MKRTSASASLIAFSLLCTVVHGTTLPSALRRLESASLGSDAEAEPPAFVDSFASLGRSLDRRGSDTDLQILNFALGFEYLESALYQHGLSKYSEDDFRVAGQPDWAHGRFEQMAEHEETHVQFLQSAITSARSEYVLPCEYSFNDHDVQGFVILSEALETIVTSAYTGSISFISHKPYITAGASILATEARHSAWVNAAMRRENPWSTAFETPLTANQVFTLASTFTKSETCPQSNMDLLPYDLHSYPILTLPPLMLPGQETELVFPTPSLSTDERLYAAFLSGPRTIFAPLTEREGRYFVGIPRDLRACGAVFVLIIRGGERMGNFRTDDASTVAGPALVIFPFDGHGDPLS